MAKKLVAKTGIKYGNDDGMGFINEGDTVDTSKFTREQLKELYDAGAVAVEGQDDTYVGPDTSAPADPNMERANLTASGEVTPAAEVNKGKK